MPKRSKSPRASRRARKAPFAGRNTRSTTGCDRPAQLSTLRCRSSSSAFQARTSRKASPRTWKNANRHSLLMRRSNRAIEPACAAGLTARGRTRRNVARASALTARGRPRRNGARASALTARGRTRRNVPRASAPSPRGRYILALLEGAAMKKPTLLAVAIVFTFAAAALAQKQPPSGTATDVTNADLQAALKKTASARVSDQQLRVVDVDGEYNVAVGILHRAKTDSRPSGALTHEKITEVYQIISGNGTLVTGGSLVNPKESPADSEIVKV